MDVSTWIAAAPVRDPNRLLGDILPWLIVLIAVVIAGGVVIFAIRRWLRGDGASSAAGFTLQDLRDLHARGELSDEQFNSAKAAMIGRLTSPKTQPAKSEDAGPTGSSTGNHPQSSS